MANRMIEKLVPANAAAGRGMLRFRGERGKDLLFLAAMIAPALTVLTLTIGIPIVKSLYLSFFEVTLLNMSRSAWNDFENYRGVFEDGEFFRAVKVTFTYVFSIVSVQFALGLGLALLLNRKSRMQRALRTVILIPWVIPTMVGALLWMWLFQPQYGIINYVLMALRLTDEPLQWLSDVHLALPAVIVAALWKQLPFMATMLLAGMQGISEELYEAARMDGASRLQQFAYVTLPMLKNTIKTVTLIACIENFKMFPLFWVMTGGGPLDATTTLAVFSYEKAFVELDLGGGAAIGALWLVLMLLFAWGYNRLFAIGEAKEARA